MNSFDWVVSNVQFLSDERGRRGDLVVDGNSLIDLDHHGIVHPDNADEVAISVGQIYGVDLELLVGAIKMNMDNEISLDETTRDVGRIESSEAGTEVKYETILLPSADEHGDVHARSIRAGVIDVDNGNARSFVFVSKGSSSVIVLAGRSQERPMTRTLVFAPQVRAESVILAGVGVALFLA